MNKSFLLVMLFASLIVAQQKNKLTVDEKSGKQMLIGICDRTAFADTNFAWWFNGEYDNYTPASEFVEKIKTAIGNTDLTIIMGSWCSDSRREVPRLFKILDAAGYDAAKPNLICVDRSKKSPDGDIDKLDIKLVPTIILTRDGKEIGRIIESPKKKLEEDLWGILSN